MVMLCLSEAIDQLVMANNVHWYGHVLRMENSLFMRTLYIEIEGQRRK